MPINLITNLQYKENLGIPSNLQNIAAWNFFRTIIWSIPKVWQSFRIAEASIQAGLMQSVSGSYILEPFGEESMNSTAIANFLFPF